MIGDTYGLLTVISEAETKDNIRFFNFRCKCGEPVTVTMGKLRNGHTQSCGCHHRKISSETNLRDIKGETFGKLTVLERSEEKTKKPKWICKCECGTIKSIFSQSLLQGITVSCGCYGGSTENAREALLSNYTVDGVIVPNLTKVMPNNKSGHKGVFIEYNKNGVPSYKASIGFKGKRHYLGRFSDMESAVQARETAEEKFHNPYIEEFRERSKVMPNNKSGHKGVFIEYNQNGVPSYKASIGFKGKRHYLGRFSDMESAVQARKAAEEKFHNHYIKEFRERSNKSE